MQENSYFSRKLTGGAISQRGFRYQTLVSIKYLMESMNDPTFVAMALEQDDDFTLHFQGALSILCQVKSILYDMGDLRNYLDSESGCGQSRVLICSGFSKEVQSMIEKKIWYEQKMAGNDVGSSMDKERLTEDYNAHLSKDRIKFDRFQSVKLDSIPVDYAETIAQSAIFAWAQNNERSINTEKLFESLYLKISHLSAVRGVLRKSDVLKAVDNCLEKREEVYTYLGLTDSSDLEFKDYRQIYYIENRTAKDILIHPNMRYWDDILQQKEAMVPISYIWEPFSWDLPNLDIKVLNTTDRPLYLTEIVFEVHSSKPDPSPILYIKDSPFMSNHRHLALRNDGWGSLKNVRIQINSSPFENQDFNDFGASESLGAIEKGCDIDLTKMLQTITGIEFDQFDQAVAINLPDVFFCDGIDYYRDLKENLFKEYLGVYAKGIAYVNGILDFDADTIEGDNRHYSIKFSLEVDLYDYSNPGIPAPPSYQYDIKLRAFGESYVVRKAISQVLKPGDSDRFNVRIHCEQSARHIMNVCLMDISGNTIPMEGNIQLDMWVPQSGAGFVREYSANFWDEYL